MPVMPITSSTCVIRETGSKAGRTRWVSPGLTASRHLHFGRVRLVAGAGPLPVETERFETGLVCLHGEAAVGVGGRVFTMQPYDALYVPRDTAIEVAPGSSGCDLAELAAPVEGEYPLQFVSFADVQRDPGLHFQTGGPASSRVVNLLLAKNVTAGRIVAGVTFSEPGHWTSWPPHEHTHMLEEAYLYVAMPAPAFGVQLVYSNTREPELATIVREDDVVLRPQGYPPNVAAPGCPINVLWMMAANREVVDRQFGVVNVQPEFAAAGSGLERGQAGAPPAGERR